MAFASRAHFMTAGGNTSETTHNGTTLAAINSGDLLIVKIACANLDATDGETSVVTSITIGTNTLTKIAEFTNGNGSAGAGITIGLWYKQNADAVSSGGTVTVVFASAITPKVLTGHAFTMDNGQTLTVVAYTTLAEDASGPGAMTISSLASHAYLFLRPIGTRSSADVNPLTTGYGLLFTNAGISTAHTTGEWDVLTGTGSTSDPGFNGGATSDIASILAALSEGDPGASTDVFYENRHPIEQGMKPNTAAGMGGALIE